MNKDRTLVEMAVLQADKDWNDLVRGALIDSHLPHGEQDRDYYLQCESMNLLSKIPFN